MKALNEKWINWLNSLSSENRQLVLDDELFYFDEFVAARMSLFEILEDAGCLVAISSR